MALYAGLMSGTSLDGVDGVLAELDDHSGRPLRVLVHQHVPLGDPLAAGLLALNQSGPDELHRAALATNGLMRVYADLVHRLLARAGRRAVDITAVGAHGQTVRHQPLAHDGTGYTLQLANGALLAELTGITTVCDFRSADVAAGGQGAPLVPAFHAATFAAAGTDVAVLNVGGIANLTLLAADGGVLGFDTGPGNVLMDLWCRGRRGQAYDAGGTLAASGRVQAEWLKRLLSEPYFDRAPPKSTGRDLFHAAWLDGHQPTGSDADVMATLAELTVQSVIRDLKTHLPAVRQLRVCGGGAFNQHLMSRWRSSLPEVDVATTAEAGVPPEQVEALAFAWLAFRRLQGRSGSLPAVTGARGPRVLGAVHAAP